MKLAGQKPRAGSKPVTKIKIDFTGVESGGLIREGDVKLMVDEVTLEKGDQANFLKWKFKAVKPDNGLCYHNTSLAPQSLWALRGLLEYMNFDVPDGALDLDFEELKGEIVGATVYHDTYENKKQAKIGGFFNAETGETDTAGGPQADDTTAATGANDDANGSIPDDQAIAEEELPKLTADAIGEMSDSDLESLVDTYSLEIDLREYPTARKKKNAVIDAMETAGHLEAEAAA